MCQVYLSIRCSRCLREFIHLSNNSSPDSSHRNFSRKSPNMCITVTEKQSENLTPLPLVILINCVFSCSDFSAIPTYYHLIYINASIFCSKKKAKRPPFLMTFSLVFITYLFRPGSCSVLALFECSLCNEFAVFIVNSYLNFVEVFRALLTACVCVRSDFLRYRRLVRSGLLR